MKIKIAITIILAVLLLFALAGSYRSGRNDVLISEYKKCQADLLYLTAWDTNKPAELKEAIKARYYYLSNRIPTNWADPKDYGPVSTNLGTLGSFKGPTSAQIEYSTFLTRYGLTK